MSSTSASDAQIQRIRAYNERVLRTLSPDPAQPPKPSQDRSFGIRNRRLLLGAIYERQHTYAAHTPGFGQNDTSAPPANLLSAEAQQAAIAALGFNIAANSAGSSIQTQEAKEEDDDFEVLAYDLEYDEFVGDMDNTRTSVGSGNWITVDERKAQGQALNNGGNHILDTSAPCSDCQVPITVANAVTESKANGFFTVRKRCRPCYLEHIRITERVLPKCHFRNMAWSLVSRINDIAKVPVFKNTTDNSSHDAALPVKNALATVFLKGAEGSNGRDALFDGMSDKDWKKFQIRIKKGRPFQCATSDQDFVLFQGTGGLRPSIDRANFLDLPNASGGVKRFTPIYFSKHQHLFATSLEWNLFGGQRFFTERLDAMLQSAKGMDRAKQMQYWSNLEDFIDILDATHLPPITQRNLATILATLGLESATWAEWSTLLSRARGCAAVQTQKAARGRIYTASPSNVQKLALLMLWGKVDALTGEPLAVADRSLDAVTLDMGHCLRNVCVTSKWHNYLKSAWYPFYTREGLMVWALEETQITVNEEAPSPLRIAGEVLWRMTSDFYRNVLGCETNADKVDLNGVDLDHLGE